MSLSSARWAYWAAMACLLLGYFAWPQARPVLVAGVGALSVSAVVFGVIRLGRPRRGAWLLITLTVLLITIGDVLLNLITVNTFDQLDYPSPHDVLFVAMCLPLIIGLLWLGRPLIPSRDWPMVLDTAMLSLAGSLLVGVALVRPAVVEHNVVGAGMVAAFASWVAFVAVLAATARVVLAWWRTLAVVLLGAGVASMLVSAYFYGTALVRDWTRGTPVDLGFLVFCGLCGTAAMTPVTAPAAWIADAHLRLNPSRLALLAVAMLAAPTALLQMATSGMVTVRAAIAVVFMATGLLLLVRLALATYAFRRRVVREEAVRIASRNLGVAATETEVIDHLTTALTAVLPSGAAGQVRLGDRSGSPSSSEPISVTAIRESGQAEFAVTMGSEVMGRGHEPSSRTVVIAAPMVQVAELASVLYTLAQQAGSALARIELIGQVVARERERYFRTLVQTSSDVILISRNGRIDYATPSAWIMFGRDVRGEQLDDLITSAPARHPAESSAAEDAQTEGYVRHAGGGVLTVLRRHRDLTDDPTVNGIVTTLRDVTAEREAQRSLAYRATHDALTGLVNAERFREELGRDAATAAARAWWAVLFVDLDDFKAVNDAYGHEVGDGLLVTVAHRIRSCLRDHDLAARLGGDEFGVLLRDVPDPEAAAVVAQRITDSLALPATVAGVSVNCRASIGLALAEKAQDYDSLLRRADAALYRAKADGKGRWRQFHGDMLDFVRRRADRRAAIETVIRQESLTLHYQPIVDLATGATVGFEALIRSTAAADFQGEPPTAEEFIDIADDTDLIVQLGDWVLTHALRDVRRLSRPGTDRPRFVSVNLSARQLREPGLADQIQGLLTATGVDPSLLVLEITEKVLVPDTEQAWGHLAKLRRAGVRVAIDDYGTGYASLSYLRQPNLDLVKIDHTFLQDIDSPRTRILLDAVMALTAKLGLDQIAEGIEDIQTRDVVFSLGCRYGQGYLFAKPMPIAEAADWDLAVSGG